MMQLLSEDDPRIAELVDLTNRLNALLGGCTTEAVLNGIGIIMADFLSNKTEEVRKDILDQWVDTVKHNTRRFAGEATA